MNTGSEAPFINSTDTENTPKINPPPPIQVLTASEFKQLVRDGKTSELKNADIVTCGTFGVMSGTSLIVSFKAADPGIFERADFVSFNGISAAIGPCPNENNGYIDAIIFGTSVSSKNKNYGGGHLCKDFVLGKEISVQIISNSKSHSNPDSFILEKTITIKDLETARIIVTRGAFQNYSAFVNCTPESFETIFSVLPMPGNAEFATVSGCGEINPLQNDPKLCHHKPGTAVLLNGVPGVIIGTGTRSRSDHPNLSIYADLFHMNPDLMGGFITSKGAECLTSIATAIPVSDDETLNALCILDSDISLPISEIHDRVPFTAGTYADVWTNTDRFIHIDLIQCIHCSECAAQKLCPMEALSSSGIPNKDCVSCLTCTVSCQYGVYTANGGTLSVHGKSIPIKLRQSDRNRGEQAASLLKDEILNGRWRF